ncbi:ATP-binding protein [Lentzea cavernae]|uniref:LuxR family transcriptional regulator n=1 Tax=Lentzea cavernae TaxID=2020703 RepID=A0ABQ3MTH4_9PSEU|nr:AAA family ATPase [Lentzea cavernae]GHH56480.1 LuxR family transcriptional regulator [Lentzea cavernae]
MDEILGTIRAARTPLVSVTGPAGVGRTQLLARLSALLTADGRHVTAMRFTSDGNAMPARFALPDAASPHDSIVGLRGPVRSESIWASLGPVVGAAGKPDVARSAATSAAAALRRSGPKPVLLIDDAQWIDPDSLAVLEALVQQVADSPLTCVVATRTPAPGITGRAAAARLRRAGLVESVRLRPLRPEEVRRTTALALQAVPDDALADHVLRLSRGIPAAVGETLDQLRADRAIRVVDQRAYLVAATGPSGALPPGPLLRAVRELGPDAWAVAKAVATLAPFGAAVPELVGAALNLPVREVERLIDVLRAEGVLHRGLGGASWRFQIPLVAEALVAARGPFERRHLAAQAVTSVWNGAATCADEDHFTNLIADAGRLVDSRRALGELLSRSATARADLAQRWLGAATELSDDRTQRSVVLLQHTTACHVRGDREQSLRGALLLLAEYADQLNSVTVQELQAMAVYALSSLGHTEVLRALAERTTTEPFPPTVVTSALAFGMLDRWREAGELVPGSSEDPLSQLLLTMTELWQGNPERFEQSLETKAGWPPRTSAHRRFDHVNAHVTALLVIGDLDRADKLLIEEGLDWHRMQRSDQAMAAALRGQFDVAAETARRGVADRSACSFDAGNAGMHHATVSALVAQGKVLTARKLLAAARTTTPVLAHLLDMAEGLVDRALGDTGGAISRLRATLHSAAGRGLLVGADLGWAELVDLALDTGATDTAEEGLRAVEELAATMPTSRVTMHAAFVRAVVGGDAAATQECLRRLQERGHPGESAVIRARLVKHGAAPAAVLGPVYAELGELGAFLYRARARNLMRELGVTVPGRQEAVAENEYLLTVLAAEGLSNKQIAATLRTSDKSVEGRLSRLFARHGLTSRIELSQAILDEALTAGGTGRG